MSINGSLIHNLARQAVDVEAAFFENLDSRIPIHDAAIRPDLQCFSAAWSE
jgi:hypothetical protein